MDNYIDKTYNPSLIEKDIYDLWNENDLFKINFESGKKVYSVVMPPPNITGVLHMGHALNFTLQDILVRFKRMMGFEIVWIPGTDHSAIATEAKVVEALKKENLTKQSIGYEKFMERCWKWKEDYGGTISKQIRYDGTLSYFPRIWTSTKKDSAQYLNKAWIHKSVHKQFLINASIRTQHHNQIDCLLKHASSKRHGSIIENVQIPVGFDDRIIFQSRGVHCHETL